jgi:hypothetical protein
VNAARIAALAVAVALVVAEIVRPTTVPAKRLGHPSLARAGGQLPLSQEQLDDLPPIIAPAIGNIDVAHAIVRGRPRPLVSSEPLAGNDGFEVAGWCADPEARAAGAGLVAIVDGSRRIDASAGYGGVRPDVARLFASPAMAPVAFDVRLRASQIGPGRHSLRVAVVARDGRGIFVFPTVVRISVAP